MLFLAQVGKILSFLLDLVIEFLDLVDDGLVVLSKFKIIVLLLFDLCFESILEGGGIAHGLLRLVDPVNEKRCLEELHLLICGIVLLGFSGLLFERTFALFEFTEDVIYTQEVLFSGIELSFGFFLADLVFYDSGSFFHYAAPVF